MSEGPRVKVVILKGPRAGETLDFGEHVRIGRVIRGNSKGYRNNLVIKDGGVSTEHLSIHFHSGRWVVEDRGSSNGTILNDIALTPNTAFPLHSHDVLKIGELTSFSVIILDTQETQPQVLPRRGRPRKVQDSNPPVDVDVKVSPTRTRTRTRGKKIEGTSDLPPIQEETASLNLEVANKRRAGTRRPNKRLLPEEAALDSVPDHKENQHTSNPEQPDDKVAQIEFPSDKGNVEEEEMSNLSQGGRVNVAADIDNDERLKTGEDNSKVAGSVDVVAKGSSSNVDVPDLEKLTLGEWFGYLQVHLPKQIIDETEELIQNMRQKAIRVHEYRLQQMKGKESVG